MRQCEIDQNTVDCSSVTVDSHSFGKPLSPQHAMAYRLSVDFADVVASFSSFYQSFMEREAEDEGFEESPQGDYLRLRETGYLSLERMLTEQPELLSRVLLRMLPSEFMGYLFRKNASIEDYSFALQTLTSVDIDNGIVRCEGDSFLIPRRKD